MTTNGYQQREMELTRERIWALLQGMPADNLIVVEKFVLFMRQQDQQVVATMEQKGQTPYLFPTVSVPASSLDSWSKLLDKGYEGDALADTESIYDDV